MSEDKPQLQTNRDRIGSTWSNYRRAHINRSRRLRYHEWFERLEGKIFQYPLCGGSKLTRRLHNAVQHFYPEVLSSFRMDDDLVLNLVVDDVRPKKGQITKKGGRWIERSISTLSVCSLYLISLIRLKQKRLLKRKVRTDEESSPPVPIQSGDTKQQQQPPSKKARTDTHTSSINQSSTSALSSARPTQIISSLFSYNPKVEQPTKKPSDAKVYAPSNAPLDSSTFAGLGLNPLLISHLTTKLGIQKPTAIQRAALPLLLEDLKKSRDVFLQSQTGSGKTLSYLLPIIQNLLPLSSLSYIDRSIGTLAIIIAPTRELAKQISDVVDALLKMRLRSEGELPTQTDTSTWLTRWLVSGLLIGGATRTHEKARLRKGIPILVSTPGRLLDHLQNTSSFNVGKCRWLVLDEADQLMELGFEDTIKSILQGLDGRRRLAKQAIEEGKSKEVNGWDWEQRRRTLMCSATIREDVQKLAGTALVNPLVIKATEVGKDDLALVVGKRTAGESLPSESFTPPSQLLQKYIVVPLKLRLVTLVALLRTLVAEMQLRKGTKILVFFSCTASVDFHWHLLGDSAVNGGKSSASLDDSEDSDSEGNNDKLSEEKIDGVEARCSFLPGVLVYRLHGSLATHARLSALKGFAGKNITQDVTTSVLFCTSVASRGLDLPLVRAVIQYDLPTEGGVTEYVHRVGRTARAGKGGEAWSFVAPSEVEWVQWVESRMGGEEKDRSVSLSSVTVEDILRSGFGGSGIEYEHRATEIQLAFERWVLSKNEVVF